MRTIFTLASGRSGTSYLAYFFKDNVKNCYSTHEPYLTIGNPVLFGKPIAWNTYFEDEKLLPLLRQKRAFITGLKQPVYFESNHAFLKSCHRYAPILIDQPGFIHLVRDPRYVAKSELNRERLIQRMHVPFAYYRMNGEYYFRWALTGKETIFDCYQDIDINRFQFYLLQWIELEYRALQLLEDYGWRDSVFFVEVEKDLKNESVMHSMLDFFNLETNRAELNMNHSTNKTPFIGKTTLTAADIEACKQVVARLPQRYLFMLQQAPYKNCGWADLFLNSDSGG